MFNNGLIENDQDTVKLHSLSARIFGILLDFIYIGEFVCFVNSWKLVSSNYIYSHDHYHQVKFI